MQKCVVLTSLNNKLYVLNVPFGSQVLVYIPVVMNLMTQRLGVSSVPLVFAQAQKPAWKAFTLSAFVCARALAQARVLGESAQLRPATHIHQGCCMTVRTQSKHTESPVWRVLSQTPDRSHDGTAAPVPHKSAKERAREDARESNGGNNGRLDQERQQQHAVSQRRRVNQFQRHSSQTRISWCVNFSRPPRHPPPDLRVMDYHRSPSQRVGASERAGGEREVEEGGWRRSAATGTQSSEGSTGLKNYGLTEIWGG